MSVSLFAERNSSSRQTSPVTRCIYNAIFLLNGTSSDIAIEKSALRPFFRSHPSGAVPPAGMSVEPDKNRIKYLPFDRATRLMKIPIVNPLVLRGEIFGPSIPISCGISLPDVLGWTRNYCVSFRSFHPSLSDVHASPISSLRGSNLPLTTTNVVQFLEQKKSRIFLTRDYAFKFFPRESLLAFKVPFSREKIRRSKASVISMLGQFTRH